jgi:hypothetical protein
MSTDEKPPMVLNPTLELYIEVRARMGAGIGRYRKLQLRVGRAVSPELVREVLSLLEGRDPSELKREDRALLAEFGLLVPEGTELWQPSFAPPLGTVLAPIVPYREPLLGFRAESAERYVLNPDLALQTGPQIPTSFADRCSDLPRLGLARPVLWCSEPGTGLPMLYFPQATVADQLPALLSGELQPRDLDPMTLFALARADVLITPEALARRRSEWEVRCAEARRLLERDQFVVLRNLVSPLQLGGVREYFRDVRDQTELPMGDNQVDKRKGIHNDPIAGLYHASIATLINRIVPTPVRPSYCYVGMYYPGAILAKHVDREQCAWNVSLALDYEPDRDASDAWPIWVEVDGKPQQVRLAMGDAILYRGDKLPHWRDAQPEGHMATVCFYHFVDPAFRGRLA